MVHTVGKVSYHVSKELLNYWKKYSLSEMKRINRDKVDLVDGGEGTGKSTWVFQQAGYIEPGIFDSPEKFCSRIAFSPEEFFDAVRNVKNGVIIFDEAFRGFSSRSALSKINRKLVQALMEMRQQNNIVFVVLPSFFLLDIYPAMLRSHALFNIYINKNSGRRVWQGYNKWDKNQMYQKGLKKGWSYHVKSRFRGYFFNKFPGGPEFEEAYLKKKSHALRTMDLTEKEKVALEKPIFANPEQLILLKKVVEYAGSHKKAEIMLREAGLPTSSTSIGRFLQEKPTKTEESTPNPS